MPLLVYITCATMEEAQTISTALLEERLVAGTNIVPQKIQSLYWWKGKRQSSEEILLLAKTMEDRFALLNERVRALHSYETPCVVALPLVMGDEEFLAWIQESTRPL